MTDKRVGLLTYLQTKFAQLTHTHTYSNINNVNVVTVNVTYSDSTTGTIKLLQYTGG